ncbi:hypothetical protein [Nocardia seriolae]|nr:hypothetical protein [Nocardia seriolae]
MRLADRLLGMVVRGFDYLPVVDVTFGDVVRATVTADRRLYPEDRQHLRSMLVEAFRRRGIWPKNVTSLTDDALVWVQPDSGLQLTGSVDLSRAILSASRDLDPIGHAGELRTPPMPNLNEPAESGDSASTHQAFHELAKQIKFWAKANALQLGLDPNFAIDCEGIHVSYRRAGDRLPRPELAIQLLQRREDLEDSTRTDPPRIYAGTALVVRADGRVDYVITKPLPFSSSAMAAGSPAMGAQASDFHAAGIARLERMRCWFARVEAEDSLSPWTAEHAIHRLDFARIHAAAGQ